MDKECIGMPHQNYLCSLEGYDFVEQFVEQFFSTYDAPGRPNMKGLYRDNAIMTISLQLLGVSHESAVKRYIVRSRNVLKITNYATASATTFVGPEHITSVWRSFGVTQHDFKSFCIDMTHYTVTTSIALIKDSLGFLTNL